MIRALIIDDEPLARSIVKEYLLDYPDVEIIGECNDGFEGIKLVQQFQPDLIFLDIQMPKITGFEMLELIEQPPAIIFTTAFDEFAIRAFELHAIDYLLKPFGKDRFARALEKFSNSVAARQMKDKARQLIEQNEELVGQAERIVVKTGSKIKIIPIYQVLYLEAADDYVKIFTPEGSFLKNRTMNWFEKALPSLQFVRIHRSYMVNIQEITRIDPYEKDGHVAILRNGSQIPVSKNGYSRLRMALGI